MTASDFTDRTAAPAGVSRRGPGDAAARCVPGSSPPARDLPPVAAGTSRPPAIPVAGGRDTPSPGPADEASTRISGAGSKPGRSVPRGVLPAQETGEPGRADTSPARPGQGQQRIWRLDLPPGLALLSLNDRGHWAARYRRSEALKKAAWAMALQQKIPRLKRVSVDAEYQPGDLRHRDPDNIAASVKAAIDGLRAAKVLPEDDSRHVTEVTCRIGPLYPKGRLVLYITEVAAAGSSEGPGAA